jgi:predicted alpha/beta hydrolase
VPQTFYRHFARVACQHGFEVVTFDYRGIGRSAPASLKGFDADLSDWGSLDLTSVVDACTIRANAARVPLYVVAHSFGGHAFGMLPRTDQVKACFTFGTGAGWHGHMPRLEQLRVSALWQFMAPLLNTWKGYLAWSHIGMGEDLPREVYLQWRRWCRYPRFFFDDPQDGPRMSAAFARVTTRMLAAAATDDRWSPPVSRDAILAGYKNARLTRVTIDPADHGLAALGHLGFFRAHASALWPATLRWLDTGGEWNIEP